MRRLSLALLIAAPLALVGAPLALAQLTRTPGANAKYHAAAQAYVAGETERAVQEAEAGLALDPDNARLQKLLDLLRQQKPPQDGDDGEQDSESDSGDQGDEQQDGDPNQQNGDSPEADDPAQRDGTQQDTGSPEEQRDDARGQKQPGQPTPGDASGKRPARMSAAEAGRLLDAVGAEEELLVSRMRRPTRTRRSERDW